MDEAVTNYFRDHDSAASYLRMIAHYDKFGRWPSVSTLVRVLLDANPEATAKYHDRLHGIDKRFDAVMRRKG